MARQPKASVTERDLLKEISHKLDVLIGTVAGQGMEPAARIRILTKLGLPSREIGTLLNVHPDSVRRARSRK